MKARCGLANPENACPYHRRVERVAVELNRLDLEHVLFSSDAQNASAFPEVLNEIRMLEETQRAFSIFRSHSAYTVPDFTEAVHGLLSAQGALRDYFQ